MTCRALPRRLRFGSDSRTVSNRDMAMRALDFMIGDMLLMHEFEIAIPFDMLQLRMAGTAPLGRHVAVSGDGGGMAADAIDLPRQDLGMIERRVGGGTGGRVVAVRAARQIGWPAAGIGHEMTKEAGAFGHGDMFPLNDLRMARGATEPAVAARLFEMGPMIENHILEIFDTF